MPHRSTLLLLLAACLPTCMPLATPSASRRAFITGVALSASTAPLLLKLPASASTMSTAASSSATSAYIAPTSATSEFYSGMLAGAVQKTVKELALHPLDTAKARLQVAGSRSVVLGELFATPYDGLAPALIAGAPAASAFFAVKDAAKRGLASASLDFGKTETTLLAVLCANLAYWGIKNPSEVLKVRRQAGGVDDTLDAAKGVWQSEGLAGFYSSAGANYAYSAPVDCTKFVLCKSSCERVQ